MILQTNNLVILLQKRLQKEMIATTIDAQHGATHHGRGLGHVHNGAVAANGYSGVTAPQRLHKLVGGGHVALGTDHPYVGAGLGQLQRYLPHQFVIFTFRLIGNYGN